MSLLVSLRNLLIIHVDSWDWLVLLIERRIAKSELHEQSNVKLGVIYNQRTGKVMKRGETLPPVPIF